MKIRGTPRKLPILKPGDKFHYWTVISDEARKSPGKFYVDVRCICGNVRNIWAANLIRQKTKSCGCWNLRQCSVRQFKHGHAQYKISRTYRAWLNMIQRCTNLKNKNYKQYGGRGIKVCAMWKRSFEAFLRDMGEAPHGQTLDRIKNNLGYSKKNCRWASRGTQAENRRNNINVSYKGEMKTLSSWGRDLKINPGTLYYRYKNGLRDADLFDNTGLTKCH